MRWLADVLIVIDQPKRYLLIVCVQCVVMPYYAVKPAAGAGEECCSVPYTGKAWKEPTILFSMVFQRPNYKHNGGCLCRYVREYNDRKERGKGTRKRGKAKEETRRNAFRTKGSVMLVIKEEEKEEE